MELRGSRSRGGAGRAGAALVALGGAVLAGCGDWPHFDYAPAPLARIDEVEAAGKEAVQDLSELHGDVEVAGRIDAGWYVPTTEVEAPFGLPGWYAEDIDWFQFSLFDPQPLEISLTWALEGADLDLYFFSAARDGQLTLIDYRDHLGMSPEQLEPGELLTGTLYVVAVSGREGEAVDYTLTLRLLE